MTTLPLCLEVLYKELLKEVMKSLSLQTESFAGYPVFLPSQAS